MNTEQIIDAEPEPTMNETFVESYGEVKSILVSQPKPTDKSPYYELEKKYNLTIDWRSFIHVEPVPARDFRKFRIRIEDFSAIVLTSKNSVDHFFRMAEGN